MAIKYSKENDSITYFEKTLGKKWNLSIVRHLLSSPKRFNQLLSVLNISARILSIRLKELESENIIKKTIYPDKPVRIEYTLTSKGKKIEPIIKEIHLWQERVH